MTKIVSSACSEDCGGRCVLKFHVRDGGILKVETDDDEGEPQLKACVRGRAQRQRIYAPDRLLYPRKRIGPRGEGKFERISWDEALDTIAGEMERIKETYGSASILHDGSRGIMGLLHSWNTIGRLLFMFGGCTLRWGSASCEGSNFSSKVTYGTPACGNSRDDLLNSHLIIMWGWNPAETIWGTGKNFSLIKAKEKGIKIICVDPKLTNTTATLADTWIPIRPSTDAAMMIAMAYVMITENLHDKKFLDTYAVGFDKFRDYVLGSEDSIPKTPVWAEAITGVSAVTIESLAREYATTKPAALMPSWAPGRSARGEQYHRAASTLAAMTGNVGIHGGCAAGKFLVKEGIAEWAAEYGGGDLATVLPPLKNPLEPDPKPPGIDPAISSSYRVHSTKVWDNILKGEAGGYPRDLKMAYIAFGNLLNQRLNINKGVEALKKLEFVVVHEQFMTPTAKFADILLPVSMSVERNDILPPWLSGPYIIYANKVVDPLGECKTDFQICCELAERLGITGYSDKTEEELLREAVRSNPFLSREIPDYDDFKKRGFHKVPVPEPIVAFRKQIEDPKNNPFPTPSGKIEIFSQRMADINNPELPPIPKYIEPWEGPSDPLIAKYPLQLVTNHSKVRAHSVFYNTPWLRELEPQMVWINTEDARLRRIRNGEKVRVFNDRGQMIIPAKVTNRIMPGVVSLSEGAWYTPDQDGVDRGGSVNVLTRDEGSPGGAFCTNTTLVQVEKAEEAKGRSDKDGD